MKKILLLLSFLVAFFVSNAQYPVTQFLGRDSVLVDSRGGLKARLINYAFTDTTEANTQRISQYAGAMIYTTTGNKLWLRNSTATLWVEVGTGSGGGGGVSTVGAINGVSKSSNGAVISGATIYFQTVDATYPGLMTSAQKARLDSNSYLTIDKAYDSLAWRRNDSTFHIKSLRIQSNGVTVTPSVTDSSLSYNITGTSVDTTSISNRINSKLDTSKAIPFDTTGAINGYELYIDRTGADTIKTRSATGGASADSTLYIIFQTGVTTNAPVVGDSILYHSYLFGKYKRVYREGKLQYYDDSVGYEYSGADTSIIFHPPLSTNERIYIELKDSTITRSLPLEVPYTPPSTSIAYANSQAYTGTSATSYTFSFTVSAGTNRILIVSFEGATGTGADDITSVTYNGVAMTLGQKTAPTNPTNRYLYTYYLLNPASGANNVVISRTTSDWILPVAAEYTGVQSVESSVTYTCACSNATINYSTVQDNAWLVTAVSSTGTTITSISGLTKRVASNGTYATLFDSGALTPAGSKSYSTTGISGGQGHAGLVLKHY